MQIGLFLSPQTPYAADVTPAEHATALLDQTRTARDGGFDLVTAGQHYLMDYPTFQLFPLLSRAAAEAGSMTVATGVVLLPLHHPVNVAEQLATLSYLAEDVVAGVGLGYRDEEFEGFGVPKAERVPRLEEAVELMTRLWREADVTYDGEYYSAESATIRPRPARPPPVWIAANSRSAVERAARLGDAWYANPHASLPELERLKAAYDAARPEDRSTAIPVLREAFVAPTTEDAWAAAGEYLERKYADEYVRMGQHEAMDRDADFDRALEELAADRFLVGSPAEVCAEIERYRGALEASHVVLRVQWSGPDGEAARRCIELVGDEVIPNV